MKFYMEGKRFSFTAENDDLVCVRLMKSPSAGKNSTKDSTGKGRRLGNMVKDKKDNRLLRKSP